MLVGVLLRFAGTLFAGFVEDFNHNRELSDAPLIILGIEEALQVLLLLSF
jgi:hypothetical protein